MSEPTQPDPTIFALSSAPGRAGVSVIRVSGSQCQILMRQMLGKILVPRAASLCQLIDPESETLIDQSLCLWFPGPESFTGEDVLEFHVHGSRAVVARLIETLSRFDNCRLAEPGEFSRRSFENGKIDLTTAEGLEDLINAETEEQRRQALSQARGHLGNLYEIWRARLIQALALMEAGLDFSDEEGVPQAVLDQAQPIVLELADQLAEHLADNHRGEILRDGFRVVIAGPPNAGKSSLLNMLAQRDVAIVSDEAGTTRDVLEVHLDLGGIPVILTDTAGIRESSEKIEQEGIRRALDRARKADLILWLNDVTGEAQSFASDVETAKAAMGSQIESEMILPIFNKTDLLADTEFNRIKSAYPDILKLSVQTGAGLDELIQLLTNRALQATDRGEEPLITRQRHRDMIIQSREALERFLQGDSLEPELRAEDLRSAAHALGKITGRVDVEDILDQIFSSFCIGK